MVSDGYSGRTDAVLTTIEKKYKLGGAYSESLARIFGDHNKVLTLGQFKEALVEGSNSVSEAEAEFLFHVYDEMVKTDSEPLMGQAAVTTGPPSTIPPTRLELFVNARIDLRLFGRYLGTGHLRRVVDSQRWRDGGQTDTEDSDTEDEDEEITA